MCYDLKTIIPKLRINVCDIDKPEIFNYDLYSDVFFIEWCLFILNQYLSMYNSITDITGSLNDTVRRQIMSTKRLHVIC